MNAESEVILKIKKLSLDFHLHDENLNILDGISIDIHNEEILAVLGESGSGKSSLAKSILNFIVMSLFVLLFLLSIRLS